MQMMFRSETSFCLKSKLSPDQNWNSNKFFAHIRSEFRWCIKNAGDGNGIRFYLLSDKEYVNANKKEYKIVIKSMTRCFTKISSRCACRSLRGQRQRQRQQQIKSITMTFGAGRHVRALHDAFYGARGTALKPTCRVRNNSIRVAT